MTMTHSQGECNTLACDIPEGMTLAAYRQARQVRPSKYARIKAVAVGMMGLGFIFEALGSAKECNR